MFKLVACNLISADSLLAVEALNHGKRTAFQLELELWVRVQMLVQLPQFIHPLAAAVAMGAVDVEIVQASFQAQVGDVRKARRLTQRARLAILLDTTDTRSTKAVSTAHCEVRLAKYLEADGTLALELFLRRLDELAFVTRLPFRLSRLLLVVVIIVTARGLTSYLFLAQKNSYTHQSHYWASVSEPHACAT